MNGEKFVLIEKSLFTEVKDIPIRLTKFLKTVQNNQIIFQPDQSVLEFQYWNS